MSSSAPSTSAEWVTLGRIVGLFGVRGQLKVQSYTDPADGLLKYPQWRLEMPGGRVETRRLREGRRKGGQVIVSLDEIGDCDTARLLVGADVKVPRGEMPRLSKGEFYEIDLIGLKVLNEQGQELGKVAHFLQMPAHSVMVVRGGTQQGSEEQWLPVTPQHLLRVNLEAGEVLVNWNLEGEV